MEAIPGWGTKSSSAVSTRSFNVMPFRSKYSSKGGFSELICISLLSNVGVNLKCYVHNLAQQRLLGLLDKPSMLKTRHSKKLTHRVRTKSAKQEKTCMKVIV